jgi:hypothetical protein
MKESHMQKQHVTILLNMKEWQKWAKCRNDNKSLKAMYKKQMCRTETPGKERCGCMVRMKEKREQ